MIKTHILYILPAKRIKIQLLSQKVKKRKCNETYVFYLLFLCFKWQVCELSQSEIPLKITHQLELTKSAVMRNIDI